MLKIFDALEIQIRGKNPDFQESQNLLCSLNQQSSLEECNVEGLLSERIVSIAHYFLFNECSVDCKIETFKLLTSAFMKKSKHLLPHLHLFFPNERSSQLFNLSHLPGFYNFLNLVVKSTRGLIKKNKVSDEKTPRPFTSLSDIMVNASLQIYEFCCKKVMDQESLEALETIYALGTFNNFETFLSNDQIDDLICIVSFPLLSKFPDQVFRCAAIAAQRLRFLMLTELQTGGSRASFYKPLKRSIIDRERILKAFISEQAVPLPIWGRLVYAFQNILTDFVDEMETIFDGLRSTPFLIFSYRKTFELLYDDIQYCRDGDLEEFLWNKLVGILHECNEVEMKIAFIDILDTILGEKPPLHLFPAKVVRYLQSSIDSQSKESEDIYDFFANNIKVVDFNLVLRLTNRIFTDQKIIAAQCRAIANLLESRIKELPELSLYDINEMFFAMIREKKVVWKSGAMPAIVRSLITIEKHLECCNPHDHCLLIREALDSEVPKLQWTVFNGYKSGSFPWLLEELLTDRAIGAFGTSPKAKVAIAAGEFLLHPDVKASELMVNLAMELQGKKLEVPCQYRERLRAIHRELQEKYPFTWPEKNNNEA